MHSQTARWQRIVAGIPPLPPLGWSLLVGTLTFALVWIGHAPPDYPADWDYFYLAGRALLDGENPYSVVRQAVAAGRLRQPFYYPGTAAVVSAPFAALPPRLAIALFTALGMALLVGSVRGWRRWIVVSAPALQNVLFGQWAPWLTAAVGLPWLGFVWAAKPTLGLALFAGWPSRRAAIGCGLILALSFLLLPSWPRDWLDAVRGAPQYLAPVQRPGGVLLLLAFLRWRRPEARMLGVLALVPHTTGLYESLPLLLIPATGGEFALLMALEYLAGILIYIRTPYGPADVARTLDVQWPYFLILAYLPALMMVLRRPPAGSNEARQERL